MILGEDSTEEAAARVLVVDDDPTMRLLSGAALKDQMRVVEAENGLAAVEALERQPFDIVVLDIDMPVMDGFEVIERARAKPETRYLPIIVVTGREDVVSIERAFALGATSFLCKPINWNVFRHQVGYVMKVAKVERELRAENRRLERLALLRARGVAALKREIECTSESIARISEAGEGDAIEKAVEACSRLRRLMGRVSHVSDVLTGAVEFTPRGVSAYDLASAAVAAAGGGERVEVFASERLDLICDRALAQEAVTEVLANALKASPPHDKVTLKIVAAPPNRVRFEIADSGAGIPEYLLESGAEDIAPVHAGPSERPRLGLGLVLAKAVVDQHGGHFGIVSEPGQGTEVFLSFPGAAASAQGQPALNRPDKIAS